jgi:hypothetical protein
MASRDGWDLERYRFYLRDRAPLLGSIAEYGCALTSPIWPSLDFHGGEFGHRERTKTARLPAFAVTCVNRIAY